MFIPIKIKPIYLIGIITFIIISGYLFLFVIFPCMLTGGPTSLYYIRNSDTKNHTIEIKIVDSTNKTVLSQSYNIQPDKNIQYDREFGWYPTINWWTPFTWSEGEYTFIAVLDGNFTASHITEVYFTQTICFRIKQSYSKPLEISVMVV